MAIDNPKEEKEIVIVKQDERKDLEELLINFQTELGVDNPVFYKRFEKLITYKGRSIDADKFRKELFNLLVEYADKGKLESVVPVESSSAAESAVVHNIENKPFEENIDIPKEGKEINIAAISNEIIEKAKEEGTLDNIDIYLYNLIPYSLGTAIGAAGNLVQNYTNPKIQNLLSGGLNVVQWFGKRKYFTIAEMVKFLGAVNFYTMHLMRGITVKDMSYPSGTEFNYTTVSNREYVYIGEGDARERIHYEWLLRRRQQDFGELLEEARTSYRIYNRDGTIDTVGERTVPDYFRKRDEFFEEKELSKRRTAAEYKVPGDRKLGKEWEFEELKGWAALEDILKKKPSEDLIKAYESRGIDLKKSVNYRLDRDNLGIESAFSELQNRLLKKTSAWQIGAMYVWPIETGYPPAWIPFEFNPTISESSRSARYQSTQILSRMGDLQSFTGTDSLTVTLTTVYIPTARNWAELTTEERSSPQDGWMSAFDLKTIQYFELVYRSLVMPRFHPVEATTEEGYEFAKPPLLKIVMGDKDKAPQELGNAPFANLLNYPKEILGDNIKSEAKKGNYRYYRTFIATSVQINKDLTALPLFIEADEEGGTPYLKDTYGFEVNLSLTEVTPSYMDVLPNFGDYYGKSLVMLGGKYRG